MDTKSTSNDSDKILEILKSNDIVDSVELSEKLNLTHNIIVGILKSLSSKELINTEQCSQTSWDLTAEGEFIVNNCSYEVAVFQYILDKGSSPLADITKNVPNSKIGLSKAMANGWIIKNSSNIIDKAVDSVTDEVKNYLKHIKDKEYSLIPDEKKSELKKRKLIKESTIFIFKVRKGSSFGMSLAKLETELTPEMLDTDNWRELQFKDYNFDTKGVLPTSGNLHPLMKVRDEIRNIFLSMGFSEMDTGNYVESSFWNFDALFQPQQHPARDAHDTFFLTEPANACTLPSCGIVNRVEKVHSEGEYGSIGYKCEWLKSEAMKNVLRTHTTANSARFLYQLSSNFRPVKAFSIDKVFRNETLDATHLAEFHQVEGIVADYGISLGHLIGVIGDFFRLMGLKKIRFKPAYNPYTEPSMEIFCFHPGLGKWIEVGNSGMFRPEMLRPLGLPQGVTVLGWGLSLERPAMIKYGIDNIRDLVGPRVQLGTISESPICQFDEL